MGAIAGARVGKYKLETRAGKCKVSVRIGKHKLGSGLINTIWARSVNLNWRPGSVNTNREGEGRGRWQGQ